MTRQDRHPRSFSEGIRIEGWIDCLIRPRAAPVEPIASLLTAGSGMRSAQLHVALNSERLCGIGWRDCFLLSPPMDSMLLSDPALVLDLMVLSHGLRRLIVSH